MSKPGTNPAQRVVLEGYIGGMNRELDARKRQINEFEEGIKQVDKQLFLV